MTQQTLKPLYIILAGYAALLISFPLKMQPMEPYAYAAAAEGYYNLTATFALEAPTVSLPDISRYHPNHPLPHLIAVLLHSATGIGALTVFKALNFAGALLFISFFFHTASRLIRDTMGIVAATLALAFSYTFWISALSGEMQLFGLSLMMGAVYFLVCHFEDNTTSPRHLYAATALYVLAGAFHLFAFVLIIPASIALLIHSRRSRDIRLYAIMVALIICGYAFFYGLLLSLILDIRSLAEYLKTLFIYNQILLKAYSNSEWWPLLTKSMLRAWVYADNLWGALAKCVVVGFILIGYWRLVVSRLRPAIKFLLIGWPVLQILLQIAVYGRPEGLNFWLFLFPTFFLSLAMAFEWLQLRLRASIAATLLPLVLAGVNFSSAIWPNSSLQTEQVFYLKPPQMARNTPIAFVVNEPVLTFGEIWKMGSQYGFRNQKTFLPCCGERNVREKIVQWAKNQSAFLIISDFSDDLVGKALGEEKISFVMLQDDAGEIMPAWIPSSLYISNPPGTRYSKNLRVFYHAAEK